jgi:hypothetical protein
MANGWRIRGFALKCGCWERGKGKKGESLRGGKGKGKRKGKKEEGGGNDGGFASSARFGDGDNIAILIF